MSGFALMLILIAAVTHASWNLIAKKAGGDAIFVWLCSTAATVLYGPVAIGVLVARQPHLGWSELTCLLGTAVLHTGYFVFLQRGYRVGDLSLVYPLARSTGPLLSTVAAIFVLGERPSVVGIMGGLLVLVGIVVLTWTGEKRKGPGMGTAIAYGLLTGSFIAAYTLLDKFAVSNLSLPPILVDYGSNVGRTLLLLPLATGRWNQVQVEWTTKRGYVLAVAVLIPFSYILVLTAMAFTPVSYVAPAREISILVGTIFGSHLLGEGHTVRRIAAGGAMVAGIAALALG